MDLHCEMPIPFAIAALGGEVRVPTLSGAVNLKILSGTQSGGVFRVRGQGMPALHGSSHGDILARVQVEVPTRLNLNSARRLRFRRALRGRQHPDAQELH
jgi:molecular chaperone DnaJ